MYGTLAVIGAYILSSALRIVRTWEVILPVPCAAGIDIAEANLPRHKYYKPIYKAIKGQ